MKICPNCGLENPNSVKICNCGLILPHIIEENQSLVKLRPQKDLTPRPFWELAMGTCKYCGKPTGFFSTKHQECEEKRNFGWSEILKVATEAANKDWPMEVLLPKLEEMTKLYFFRPEHITVALSQVWENIAEEILDDGSLDENSEKRLIYLKDKFNLKEKDLDKRRIYSNVKKTIIDNIKLKLIELFYEFVDDKFPLYMIYSDLEELANSQFIKEGEFRDIMIEVWEDMVDHLLNDDILDVNTEKKIIGLVSIFKLSEDERDNSSAYLRMVKSKIIRDIGNGNLPIIEKPYCFNFNRNEKLVWLFHDVSLLEDKTITQYIGGSSGISVKLARGIYYRTSAFKGQPISKTERIFIDDGTMAITTKNIYFAGRKGLKIPFTKIVSFVPYSDGIGVIKDSVRANQQVFLTGDGWFIYNLCVNVSKIY